MRFTLYAICAVLILVVSGIVGAQTYNFTPAGATWHIGPTQSQVNSAYFGTTLSGQVSVVGGIQYWEVPVSGNYLIEATGGQGYGAFGGRGA